MHADRRMLLTVISASDRSTATTATVSSPDRHSIRGASLWNASSGASWIEAKERSRDFEQQVAIRSALFFDASSKITGLFSHAPQTRGPHRNTSATKGRDPARGHSPAPTSVAAAFAGYGSGPAQHFGDLSVVLRQALDLPLQILGQRPGPPSCGFKSLTTSSSRCICSCRASSCPACCRCSRSYCSESAVKASGKCFSTGITSRKRCSQLTTLSFYTCCKRRVMTPV